MAEKQSQDLREETKASLAKFADGVIVGYRCRIFEAINKLIEDVRIKSLPGSGRANYINGIKAVKNLIENLK